MPNFEERVDAVSLLVTVLIIIVVMIMKVDMVVARNGFIRPRKSIIFLGPASNKYAPLPPPPSPSLLYRLVHLTLTFISQDAAEHTRPSFRHDLLQPPRKRSTKTRQPHPSL